MTKTFGVPAAGFEPATDRFSIERSTNWAKPAYVKKAYMNNT